MSQTAAADSWRAPSEREYVSPAGQHVFRVIPSRKWGEEPGHCKATLYRVKGKTRTALWSRYLINDVAPVEAFVADSGEYVVTMDEWHDVGTLPVVIYGPKGSLIRVHTTDSLGLSRDLTHIKMTVSSYWWNENSVSFFGPKDEMFFIRLHWGKWLFLETRTGELVQEHFPFTDQKMEQESERRWKALLAIGARELEPHVLKLLGSKEAQDRAAGALICGQEKYRSSIPQLKALLEDDASVASMHTRVWIMVYHVRKAAKVALEAMGEKVDGVVTEVPVPK
jgi:hypothetical protein